MSNLKIIRTWWGNHQNKMVEIPRSPIFNNEIVYVWGEDNLIKIRKKGYDCVLVEEDGLFNHESNVYGKKLQALDMGLKDFGEVLMLDWDCHLGKPFDDDFYYMLSQKPTQVPLYAHYKEPFVSLLEAIPDEHPVLQHEDSFKHLIKNLELIDYEVPKYHWKFEDSFIIPNFGCVYSRDKNYGNDLIKIAKKYNIKGLVEELSMWKYANCSLKEYIKQFQPNYVLGVSDSKLIEQKHPIQIIQRQFNNYLKTQINYKPYLEHV